MAGYDCYFLACDGSFMAVEELDAETEADAIVQAVLLAAGQPRCAGFQLWQDGRRVHKHVGSAMARSAGRAAAGEPIPAAQAARASPERRPPKVTLIPLTLLEARAAAAKARR